MISAEGTLIEIASASQRVLDASVAYARDKNDQSIGASRTRLGGELHRIIAAYSAKLSSRLVQANPLLTIG